MNNKGFAITGILYTLLILFLLIMNSYLAILRYRNRYFIKSIESYNDYLIDNSVTEDNVITEGNKSEYSGKYVFKISDDKYCYLYLEKGVEINEEQIKEKCKINEGETISINAVYVFKDVDNNE